MTLRTSWVLYAEITVITTPVYSGNYEKVYKRHQIIVPLVMINSNGDGNKKGIFSFAEAIKEAMIAFV